MSSNQEQKTIRSTDKIWENSCGVRCQLVHGRVELDASNQPPVLVRCSLEVRRKVVSHREAGLNFLLQPVSEYLAN